MLACIFFKTQTGHYIQMLVKRFKDLIYKLIRCFEEKESKSQQIQKVLTFQLFRGIFQTLYCHGTAFDFEKVDSILRLFERSIF